MKTCKGCHIPLALDEFPPDRRAKDGKQTRCRKCIQKFVKWFYHRHPENHLVVKAKKRAQERGLDFDLSPEDLLPLPKRCPVLGIRLRSSAKPQDTDAYSLDRADNRKGYTKDNVVVMSYLANRLKNDGTAEQHERIAAWMRSRRLP